MASNESKYAGDDEVVVEETTFAMGDPFASHANIISRVNTKHPRHRRSAAHPCATQNERRHDATIRQVCSWSPTD